MTTRFQPDMFDAGNDKSFEDELDDAIDYLASMDAAKKSFLPRKMTVCPKCGGRRSLFEALDDGRPGVKCVFCGWAGLTATPPSRGGFGGVIFQKSMNVTFIDRYGETISVTVKGGLDAMKYERSPFYVQSVTGWPHDRVDIGESTKLAAPEAVELARQVEKRLAGRPARDVWAALSVSRARSWGDIRLAETAAQVPA